MNEPLAYIYYLIGKANTNSEEKTTKNEHEHVLCGTIDSGTNQKCNATTKHGPFPTKTLVTVLAKNDATNAAT